MTLSLYSSLTRSKTAFVPSDPKRVTMYVCGPTVYSGPHIGNARPAVFFDVLFRILRDQYGKDAVVYARNYTDIDDKIMERAATLEVPIDDLTESVIFSYEDDLRSINVLDPTIKPRATQNITQIIAMIGTLIQADHAYASEGHVYFDVASHSNNGALSGQDFSALRPGARVAVSESKRSPEDFVLWKPSTESQPGWPSPWGYGRPGWHIECSAMISAHLGITIDIHGGGNDLIFPHHEAEIAQSECSHAGAPLARYWVHNGMVTVDGSKMSKSLGNIVTVPEILSKHSGETLRYLLLGSYYRQPVDFTWDKLNESKAALDRLYRALEKVWDAPETDSPPDESIVDALLDDINTPEAFARLHNKASFIFSRDFDEIEASMLKSDLLHAGGLLGILQSTPAQWFKRIDPEIDRMVMQREQFRNDRKWSDADQIREKLLQRGIVIDDTPAGPKWRIE